MTIRAGVGETIRLRAVYSINGAPSHVTPHPTVRLVSPSGAESTPGSATPRNASGDIPVYDYDFSSIVEGTHLVAFRTTDPNADVQVFSEDIIVAASGSSLTAAQVWSHATRTLTDIQGLTIIQSPVSSKGDITVRRGDAYLTIRGNPIKWVSADYATLGVTSASAITFKAQIGSTIFSKAMSAPASNEVRLELTTAETGAFLLGQYKYDVSAVWSDAPGNIITLAHGLMDVKGDVP